jgi:hypothetical protein
MFQENLEAVRPGGDPEERRLLLSGSGGGAAGIAGRQDEEGEQGQATGDHGSASPFGIDAPEAGVDHRGIRRREEGALERRSPGSPRRVAEAFRRRLDLRRDEEHRPGGVRAGEVRDSGVEGGGSEDQFRRLGKRRYLMVYRRMRLVLIIGIVVMIPTRRLEMPFMGVDGKMERRGEEPRQQEGRAEPGPAGAELHPLSVLEGRDEVKGNEPPTDPDRSQPTSAG